jgi:hypothetical protein
LPTNSQNPITGECHTDFLSLYVVRQGRGTHVVNGVPYGIARGDVYVMGVGMQHFFMRCHDLVTDTIHFSPQLFDEKTRQVLAETAGFHELFIEPTSQFEAAIRHKRRHTTERAGCISRRLSFLPSITP